MKNITTEKAIDLLQSKINELDDVGSPDEFLSWQNSAIQRLQVICPESPIIKQLSDIRPIQSGTSIVNKVKPHLKNMLISLVEDIEIVGIRTFQINDKEHSIGTVTVHNTNTQSQSQNQKQEVLLNFEIVVECLKRGLRDTEIDELKEILEENEEPKIKKKKFIDKLLTFGSDVASNILANILTNPQVYEKLGRML